MTILDKVKIGELVQVNLDLTRDRLDKEIIDVISTSSEGIVSDFRITDGKGIGVILKLSNGKEQWFFENEIECIDDKGNVIENDFVKNENDKSIFEIFKELKYENKKGIKELLNPINFLIWVIVSFKDIF